MNWARIKAPLPVAPGVEAVAASPHSRRKRHGSPMSRVTGLSITTLGASNMLLMNSLIQIRHRPILDLLPGLLERGRHLVHVFWPVPAIGLTYARPGEGAAGAATTAPTPVRG
jgi:hypothetical protein